MEKNIGKEKVIEKIKSTIINSGLIEQLVEELLDEVSETIMQNCICNLIIADNGYVDDDNPLGLYIEFTYPEVTFTSDGKIEVEETREGGISWGITFANAVKKYRELHPEHKFEDIVQSVHDAIWLVVREMDEELGI